jgi:sugar phosphate isomerase/epimerase
MPHHPRRIPLSRRAFLGSSAALLLDGRSSKAADDSKVYRIIGFTKPFQKVSFEQAADTVAQIGWDGIECPLRSGGQIEPERAPDELPQLIEALNKRGKSIDLLATDIVSATQPHAEKTLSMASKHGIKTYRLGFWKYAAGKSIPDQLREIKSQLTDLVALNREIGVKAGFQNHSGKDYVGAPIWDIRDMIQDLDPERVGVCFDIGHATIEGGLSWPIEARLMAPRFTAVYVKDFVWKKTSEQTWREDWTLLGEGMVNKSFFQWLKTTSFAGPICQHHEYDHGAGQPMIDKMRKDLAVLKQWLAT